MKKLIVLAGATGVGKSKVASILGKEFNLHIINADASQFHYWMDIGTANIDEYSDGNIYELYKFFEPLYPFSIKDYQDLARERVNKLDSAIICGGSGLYIDALCLDLDLRSEKRFKDYSSFSNDELYKKLEEINPELASKTHPNNRKRVERYLEITEEASLPEKPPKEMYDILYINLERDRVELYGRINNRTLKMFSDGWIDEAKNLRKYNFDLSLIKEIGYKEIGLYLDNQLSYDEMIDTIQKETRHYAKRQMTWFRGSKKKYSKYYTFDPEKDLDLIINKVREHLK